MTYSQYRAKLRKLSSLYRRAYRNGAIIRQGENGDYVDFPNASSWTTRYFRRRLKTHRDAHPHYRRQYAREALA